MRHFLSLLLMVILFSSLGSALTEIMITVDSQGTATFSGHSDESLVLPSGISYTKGTIKGSTNELTAKEGTVWSFSYSLAGADLSVKLPKDALINEFENGTLTIEGGQIVIYGDSVVVSYELVESSDNLIWILVAIVIIGFGIYFYFNLAKKKTAKETKIKEKKKIPYAVLNDRERAIIKQLEEHGQVKSSYLRKLADIPKASFSRHIHELERKKLIRLKGEGRNKIVELSR